MYIGNILKDQDGDWYTMPGIKVRINIRIPKPKKYDQLEKAARRKAPKNDEYAANALLHDYLLQDCVLGWETVFSNEAETEIYECTSENRTELDKNWSDFRIFWLSVIARGIEADENAQKEEEKN